MSGRSWIEGYTRSRHQFTMSFGIDDLRFSTSYWYEDVDLPMLEQRYGLEFMEKVYFHIIAFEANKLASLCPDTLDLGPFARFHTSPFETLWRTVFRRVWAQWRYENDLPDYDGPAFIGQPVSDSPSVVEIEYGPVEVLSFCGGGKDSLVAMKLLERADIPYSSLAYSSSIYGNARHQHDLIDGLVSRTSAMTRHRIWMYDDFMDSPVTRLYPAYGVKSLTAAETPSSIFATLPVVLQHGYRYMCLAHERSADTGNLIWHKTGEEVNHQWGKSYEAEMLLNDYVQAELVENCQYFSLLKPVYDVLIFNLLGRDVESVPYTHSCNVQKPWCKRCPKCAYVWLNYMAYLPVQMVDSVFSANLFDMEENQLWFRQMLGLEEHTPFECVGQIAEARLAFELCRRKGLEGKAMEIYKTEVPRPDVPTILDKYLSVNLDQSAIPQPILAGVLPQMLSAAEEARERISAGSRD